MPTLSKLYFTSLILLKCSDPISLFDTVGVTYGLIINETFLKLVISNWQLQ